MGLECEFLIRHPPGTPPDALRDFSRMVRALGRRVPLAPSRNSPIRFYLANGASLSLEMGACPDLRAALLEVATPECASPKDIVVYALACERLLEESFRQDHPRDSWALIKANSDGFGHTLGQHESYDMQIARRGWLILWWLGLLALLPAVILYRLLACVWLGSLHATRWGIHRARQGVDWLRKRWEGKARQAFDARRGTEEPDATENPTNTFPSKRWMWLAATGLRLLHAPLAMGFLALVKCVALRPQRKHLSSFLASRCLLDGAGYVDEQSRFWISQRGASINAVIGYGSYGRCRPLFRCDSLLRDLIASPFGSMRRYRRLFRRRQRIEIAIGDSGMCQQSQYLRWGTTSLVLDMIENDRRCRLPRLRDPIAGIREFSRDWMLVRTLSVGAQREISALELQRSFAKQVHCWLESLVSVNAEAWQIYDLWQSTLNQMVVSPKEDPQVPMPLVGRIDWISKLWLLRQMEPNTPWSVRKKIDLRYHELSESGYHRKLDESLKIAPIAREVDIDRARRTPPSDPRPLRRGNLIREFADSEAQLQVDWTSARYSLDGVWYVVTF